MQTNEEAPGRATEGNSRTSFEDINLGLQHTGEQPYSDERIYERGVWLYTEAGWQAVLPLPPRAKSPPPKGFTGYDGVWPTKAQIDQWVAEKPPDSNLMLRLEYGLIGIDVDAYQSKTGGQTLKEAEALWGALPSTYRSSARGEDDVSGVRLFRVPQGVLFRTGIKFDDLEIGHIDIIQPHHRHITAYPSIHPNGGRYRWYGPDGVRLPEGQVPRVHDLPELPPKWVEQLGRDAVRDEVFDNSAPHRTKNMRDNIDEQLYRKLTGLEDMREPEPVVKNRLDRAVAELDRDSGSRHDTTRDHVAALMRCQAIGRVGVPKALDELRRFYVSKVADTRPTEIAQAEFARLVEGAAALIAGSMPSDAREAVGTIGSGNAEGAKSYTGAAGYRPSWSPADLEDLLNGDLQPLVPSLFERSDGQCLLYPGLVHSFHGESESGKSLIIQDECVRLLNRGEKVLYLDFESDVASVIARLLEFGADPAAIADYFTYVQPEVRPDSVEERRAWQEMLSGTYTLAVIDGVTDALGIFGCSTIDNDDVAEWIRTVPKQIGAHTGAAVVLIDHVTKDTSTRNRWAIGGQAKMAGLTGAAYTVEVAQPLGRGLRGEVVLRIAKDRPGEVRRHCGSFSKRDRTQEAARITVDSTISPPQVVVGTPSSGSDEISRAQMGFRPTHLMQRVSEEIEKNPGQLTKNQAVKRAGGKREATLLAFDLLASEGNLASERGRGGHHVYTVTKPYRETDDTRSDRFVGNAFGST